MSSKQESIGAKVVATLEKQGGIELLKAVYERLQKRFQGKTARVQYAGALSDQQKRELEQKVRKRFPDITEINFEKNDELIAGIKVICEDFVYEDSTKKRLTKLLSK